MQSGLHNKPLLPRFTTQADHRRIEPEEMIAIARERLGVALVAGLERVVGGTHIESTADHRPVAASMYLLQAHKISLEPGSMIEWQTAVAPYDTPRNGVVFAFPIAFGNGSPFPQPTGQFDLYINDDHITSFTIDKRSRRWSGSRGTLIFEAQWTKATAFGNSFNLDEQIINESQYSDGYALIHCPRHTIPEGRPSRIRITATTEVQSKNWLRVGQMGRPLEHDDLVNTLFKALPSPPQPTVGDYIVLNGDLHNHSGQSYLLGKEGCGSGTRQSLFEYARHVAGLDFFALSEHDWQMNDDDWMELNALTDSFHDPGNFLTLHGYEWTSAGHGHRNVYFRDEPGPIHRSRPIGAGHSALETNPTPEDLWRSLDQDGLAAITVPHHMSAARFPLSLRQHFQQKYDVAAEIYSSWGNSLEPDNRLNTYVQHIPELGFINAIREGYKLAFIASSDSHDGHPGNAQGVPKHRHIYHYLGSGRTGVLATDNSRQAVFDAIASRRCFAYTGGRMLATIDLQDYGMGSVVPRTQLGRNPCLRIHVDSDSPLQAVYIYRDGWQVDEIDIDGCSTNIEWRDDCEGRASSYFAKVVRHDYEMAWTTPIWISE